MEGRENTTPPQTEEAIAMTKRKVTLKLIDDVTLRKACYRKRLAGLLKKMKELSTLCDIDACAIIFGPGDKKPTIWPSPIVAKHLLQRLQKDPELVRSRKMVDQRGYMREKTRRVEEQLVKIKERNDEKEMSILMHRIYHDGKSLSDFEAGDLRRLLCYVKEKLKSVRRRTGRFEAVVPPNPSPPPPSVSCPPHDDIDSWFDIDEQVSGQQSILDLVKEAEQMNNGFDNNTAESSMGLPPHTHLSDIDVALPQGNFEELVGGSDLGSGGLLPPSNFGGLNGESDHSRSGMLSQGNFGGLNNESDHLGMLPQDNLIGLNVENDLGMLAQGNFRGLNDKSGHHSWVLPEGNFGGFNVKSDSRMLPQPQENFIRFNGESNSKLLYGSSTSEIGGSDIWPSYGQFGSTIGGSDIRFPHGCSAGNIDGTYIGAGKYNENQGGPTDNIGLWCHQNNFGVNNNEAAMGRLNANFVDTNNGRNLIAHGNFASSGERSDMQVPISFAGNSAGSYW